mgnify:FL=1
MKKHIHFISDVHLTEDRPETVQRFLAYLASLDNHVSAVYILGDLFDVWVGDDNRSAFNEGIKEKLKWVTQQGIDVYFLPGNRDFLVGQQFFDDTQITCLNDESVIDLFGTKTLLMHGDLLCTDDIAYQNFRQLTHSQQWQEELLAKPLKERLALAQHYRQESLLSKQSTAMDIMDVNKKAVLTYLKKHHTQRLIHGHTHRPNIHHYIVDNQTVSRFVLAEWDNNCTLLDWSEQGYRLSTLF